mmetsp:Transcript_56584/g.156624  ORF Transcript_56584/g.156624 Transcript_56584/m.156624 type:complete len:264 (+) Transcript_56584:1-792(+)
MGTLSNRVCCEFQRHRAIVKVMNRSAHLYVPATATPGEGVAAVFVLHGSFSKPEDMFDLGFEPLADVHGFLVVYPEMSVPRSAEWGYTSDLPYFTALVNRLYQDCTLDLARVFVCGHSAGGTMALFLQNEAGLFAAAGAVEAGVGHLDEWSMEKRGSRTMLVWNHADPVLAEYGGERLYKQTLATLRRRGSLQPASTEPLHTFPPVVSAELWRYPEDGSPKLHVLSWRSVPGTHDWPQVPSMTFDGAQQLVAFFLDVPAAARS